MMFVFGEAQDPLPETCVMVEDIILQALQQAHRRNARTLSHEDFIFIIRKDKPKVNSLRAFLSWKDVRKKANESQGNTNTTGVEGDDFLDEVAEAEKAQRIKRKQIKLSWELRAAYSDVLNLGDDDSESSDEDDEEVYQASLQRLKEADDVTRHMTREEYVHYSECRQASFTFRKGKRFREWLNMSAYMDTRPNDDVVDILGYLGFEAVRTLVEMALRVRKERDKDIVVEKKEVSMFGNKRKADEMTSEGLFATRNVDRKPLEPRDVVEAFRRLQVTKKPCWNFRGGLAKVKVSLI